MEEWIIIVSISLIIILISWLVIIYFISESKFQMYESGAGEVLVQCPVDQCATNIFNGQKRCPSSGKQIASNINFEVCSSPFVCDDPSLPFAVQSDQSTNLEGNCEQGVQCRCISQLQCPEYIQSIFTSDNGNPYASIAGQRVSFVQNTNSGQTPIVYNFEDHKFCTVPIAWLPRSTPGCSFMNQITPQTITECMGGPRGCNDSNYFFNPCSRGTLAFITNNSNNFSAESIEFIPLGCVSGSPCQCGLVAVYDTQIQQIVCKSIL